MAHKLTETQLVILAQAAQHPERAVIIPDRLRGGAVAKVAGPLLAKGLVEEVPCRPGVAAYRTGEDGSPIGLAITDPGFEALGIDVDPKLEAVTEPRDAAPAPSRTARTGTKQALLIRMLQRPEGATVDEVIAATDWQAHTVRGAISGALKKRLGFAISSENIEGRGRVYRIAP